MSINPNLVARRDAEKAKLKKLILSESRKLIIEGGLDNLTIRKIADKVKYSLPVVYSHFKDKAEIVKLLMEEEAESPVIVAMAQTFENSKEIQDFVSDMYMYSASPAGKIFDFEEIANKIFAIYDFCLCSEK